MTRTTPPTAADAVPRPWWQHGHVWLLISGPALVVVAGLVTAVIAIRGADTVIGSESPQQTARITQQAANERALLPAAQARNHAATPTVER